MKKIISIALFLICIVSAGCFTGCSFLADLGKKEISDFESLRSATGAIVLTQDIDCGYESIAALRCTSIDGNGHTIKNCVIISDDYYDDASLFSRSTKTIVNLNLANITVQSKAGISAAIVSTGGATRIDNVHITKSSVVGTQVSYGSGFGRTVQESYVGGVYGGYTPSTKNGNPTKDFNCTISNCTLEDVNVEINGSTNSSNMANIYVGGIAGGCSSISNCHVVSSTIKAKSGNTYSDPIVGGVVGCTEGSVINCAVSDSDVSADASYYQKNAFSYYSTSTALIGGISGKASETSNISYCFVENSLINGKSSGDIYIGGLIGYCENKIEQSYAINDNIIASGCAEGNKNDVKRCIGGICGYLKGSISSSFTYKNEISESTLPSNSKNSQCGGVIGDVSSAIVIYSATGENKFSGQVCDEFCPGNLSSSIDCFISSERSGNINNLGLCDDLFWSNSIDMKDKLKLVGDKWIFNDGEIAFLKID